MLGIYIAFLAACCIQGGGFGPSALERHVPDDTYYYLQIARNLADGFGSCFSIGKPTNGYHPLWLLLLSGIQWALALSRDGLVLASVLLSAAFAASTALPLAQLFGQAGIRPRAITTCTVIALANPWITPIAVNGMESGLYMLLLVCTVLASQGIQRSSWRGWLAQGCLAGSLMLTRTDAVILIASLFTFQLLTGRRSLQWLLAAGSTASLIVLPWLGWCAATFGTVMQSSSDAIPALVRSTLDGTWGQRFEVGSNALLNVAYVVFVYPLLRFTEIAFPGRAAVLILAGSSAAAYLIRNRRACDYSQLSPLWLVLGILTLLAYEGFGRLWLQTWHVTHSILLLSIVGAGATSLMLRHQRHLIVGVLAATAICAYDKGYWVSQGNMIAQAKAFSAADRPRMKIGHTDCGTFAYFGTDEVVNLDGVVNNEVLPFIRKSRLRDYCIEQAFHQVHIADDRWQITNQSITCKRTDILPKSEEATSELMGGADSLQVAANGDITLRGWITSKNLDPFATIPLVELLDANGIHLATFEALREPRRELINQSLQIAHSGFCLRIPKAEVPPNALRVRLGCKARDWTAWKPAPE